MFIISDKMGALIELECKCGYSASLGLGTLMDGDSQLYTCSHCAEFYSSMDDDHRCDICGNPGQEVKLVKATWAERLFLGIKKSRELPRFVGFTRCPKCKRRIRAYNVGFAD